MCFCGFRLLIAFVDDVSDWSLRISRRPRWRNFVFEERSRISGFVHCIRKIYTRQHSGLVSLKTMLPAEDLENAIYNLTTYALKPVNY